jgi:hypothetical protein
VSNTDLISHPCPRCKAYPPCGCTPADLKAFYAQIREYRKLAVLDAQQPKPKHHVQPTEGPQVFRERDTDQGLLKVPVDGKLLKMRSTAPEHPCRDLTNEYGQ